MATAETTPSQTIGPFFSMEMLRPEAVRRRLLGPGTAGEPIRIEGTLLDGAADPISDGLIEIWQANSHGRYHHPADQRDLPLDPAFLGYGRSGTDEEGSFWFETVKPGAVPFDAEGRQAPHLVVTIFCRGLLNHLVTRLYFEDEPANAADPILALVPSERRRTLLARREERDGAVVYRFDIRLQGPPEVETVFFNV